MTALPDPISAHWRQLRGNPLQAPVWLALSREYAARALPWQAGYAACQALRIDPAACVVPGVAEPEGGGDAQLGRPALPRATHWAAAFLDAVAASPGDWLSWLYLARLHDLVPDQARPALPQLPQLLDAQRHAAALEPMAGESLHRLGLWRLNAGDHPGAVAALARLLDLRPVRYGSMMFLGEALFATGQRAAAAKAFARAALSEHPGFLLSLADRVRRHYGPRAGLDLLHKALTLQFKAYALGDCRATLARIRALDPLDPALPQFEANLAERVGDAGASLSMLKARAGASSDPLAAYACGLPMAALYDDALSADQVAALHRDACAPLAARGMRSSPDFANPRDPARPLRIGWVSGDFLDEDHPVSLFMRPLLARLDPARFQSIIYDTALERAAGGMPRPLPAGCTLRRSVGALDDDALARIIAGDGIDILVDLAGHTACRRLGLFATRAAPVQASFLGYPHSTGLAAIDWLIGDAVVSPAAHAALFSEGLAQLPGSVFCWAPTAHFPLPPPRNAEAPLVFGSFNNALKISPRTIALWARLLHRVPGARLLLKAPSLGEAAVRMRYLGLFGAHGIRPERLELRGLSDLATMMREYGEVDIALDPSPYNGGTTTLQALWMGVPVVTLAGENFVGRMGASFMRCLGRPEWVAHDEAGYIAAALELARQRTAVRAGRACLRAQVRASALGDIDAYARHFETLLRAMWRANREHDRRRLIPAQEIALEAAADAGVQEDNHSNFRSKTY